MHDRFYWLSKFRDILYATEALQAKPGTMTETEVEILSLKISD